MVIGKFLKGLVNAEASGDFTLEAIEKDYWGCRRRGEDPHTALGNVYLKRQMFKGKDPSKPENQEKALQETAFFACLEEPDNARALGYYFMQLETPHVFNPTPKFVLDNDRLFSVLVGRSRDELIALYEKRNPEQSIEDQGLRAFLSVVVAADSELSRLQVPRW